MVLTLLCGVGAEALARPKASDAAPFHRRIRELTGLIPTTIGNWKGEDIAVPQEAIKMLRPNALLQRRYVDQSDPTLDPSRRRFVDLLLVQCGDARDMGAHYPPVCYPNQGFIQDSVSRAIVWEVTPNHPILGTEYHFTRTKGDGQEVLYVIDLLILPNGIFASNIQEVRKAASDYLRQYYGAAQIQIVFNAKYSPAERDQVFRELMAVNLPMIDTLSSGGTR
jgi:hypothetical protein